MSGRKIYILDVPINSQTELISNNKINNQNYLQNLYNIMYFIMVDLKLIKKNEKKKITQDTIQGDGNITYNIGNSVIKVITTNDLSQILQVLHHVYIITENIEEKTITLTSRGIEPFVVDEKSKIKVNPDLKNILSENTFINLYTFNNIFHRIQYGDLKVGILKRTSKTLQKNEITLLENEKKILDQYLKDFTERIKPNKLKIKRQGAQNINISENKDIEIAVYVKGHFDSILSQMYLTPADYQFLKQNYNQYKYFDILKQYTIPQLKLILKHFEDGDIRRQIDMVTIINQAIGFKIEEARNAPSVKSKIDEFKDKVEAEKQEQIIINSKKPEENMNEIKPNNNQVAIKDKLDDKKIKQELIKKYLEKYPDLNLIYNEEEILKIISEDEINLTAAVAIEKVVEEILGKRSDFIPNNIPNPLQKMVDYVTQYFTSGKGREIIEGTKIKIVGTAQAVASPLQLPNNKKWIAAVIFICSIVVISWWGGIFTTASEKLDEYDNNNNENYEEYVMNTQKASRALINMNYSINTTYDLFTQSKYSVLSYFKSDTTGDINKLKWAIISIITVLLNVGYNKWIGPGSTYSFFGSFAAANIGYDMLLDEEGQTIELLKSVVPLVQNTAKGTTEVIKSIASGAEVITENFNDALNIFAISILLLGIGAIGYIGYSIYGKYEGKPDTKIELKINK